MPTIAEILGAEKKCPVLTHDDRITMVDESKALAVALQHHGENGRMFIANPVWVDDKKLALRG